MKKIIVLALSAAFLVSAFAVASPASAITLDEIQTQIQTLLRQVTQLQTQNQSAAVIDATTTTSWCFDFKTNLRRTDTGKAVANLHIALKKQGYAIDIGEINNQRFGDSTKSAVIGFQNKYASEVLTPLGETKGTGFVGNTTRAKLNQLYGCGGTVTATTTVTPTTTTTTTEPISRPPITSPSITVVAPNDGEILIHNGDPFKISWQSSNAPDDSYVELQRMWSVEWGSGEIIANHLPVTGSYSWIPQIKAGGEKIEGVTISGDRTYSGYIEARLCKKNTPNTPDAYCSIDPYRYEISTQLAKDINDKPFRINTKEDTPLYVKVISPNGGETLNTGETHVIKWTSSAIPPSDKIKIGYRPKTRESELGDSIIAEVSNTGSYNWIIPQDIQTGQYEIGINYSNKMGSNASYDYSDAPFSIVEGTTQQPVIVKPDTQPVATLAVENTIIPFTNFTIDPQGHSINSLGFTIQKNGTINDAVFNEIVLIADYSPGINSVNEKRIIARGKLDNGMTNLRPETLGEFSGVANFTVAGVMRNDLDNYSGQVVSLSVIGSSIRGEIEGLPVDASLPITGAGHTINSTLKVGDITVATSGGATSFDSLTISNSTIEKVIIEKLAVRSKNIGSIKIKETGEVFQCQTLLASAIVGCNFYGVMAAGGVILDKGLTRTFEFQPQGNFVRVFVNDPLDSVVARGMTYNYQLTPRLGIIGGKPSITVVSPNGGERSGRLGACTP